MPANDFLEVGHVSPPAMLSQAAWAALAQRSAGWSAGILPPEHYNKALRQHAAISAMIGEFIKTIGGLDALDDGNNAVLLANFIASLDARILGAGTQDVSSFKTVTSGPVTAPPGSPVAGDEVLVADSPSGAYSGQARKLARYNGSGWAFSTVRPGRVFRVNNTTTYYQLDASTGWQPWAGPTQAAIAWGSITGTLSAQADLQAALDAKLSLTGGTMSGDIGFADALKVKWGDTSIYGFSGTALLFAVAGTERMRVNNAGNFGVGVDPSQKIHTNGAVKAETGVHIGTTTGTLSKFVPGVDGASALVANARFESWHGFGFGPLVSGQPVPVGENGVWIDPRVGDVGFRGAIRPNGNAGSSAHVLTGGAAAAWKTLAELGMFAIAGASGGPASIGAIGAPAASFQRFVTVTRVADSAGGSTVLRATFAVARPDTTYFVAGTVGTSEIGIMAKTASYFEFLVGGGSENVLVYTPHLETPYHYEARAIPISAYSFLVHQ